MQSKPKLDCGSVIAWVALLCALVALFGGPLIGGAASAIDAYGNGMRAMAGDSE